MQDHCRRCGTQVDTDQDTDCYHGRFPTCYCPSCRDKLPTKEILAKQLMAVAQVTLQHDENDQIIAFPQYWSRLTGGVSRHEEPPRDFGDALHNLRRPYIGPFPDRATAIEAAREHAIAFFQPIAGRDCGAAQTEAKGILAELKAA